MKKLFTQYGGLKKEIYILFVGRLVTAMGSFVWPMLEFFLTGKLGLSDSMATLLIAIAGVISFPAAIFGGRLADKYSRKNIIILFDMMTVTLYVIAAILPLGYHTAALVFFAGLFQTIESPAYDALNADFSTTKQREKAFSLSYLGFNLGFVFGASIGGVLFKEHTNLAFLINGLSIFTSTVLIFFFVDPKNAIHEVNNTEESYGEYEAPVKEWLPVLEVLRDRKAVLMTMLVGCFATMPSHIVGMLLPLQLNNSMGQSGAAIYGYLNSVNGLTVILLTPLLTMLLRRITELPKSSAGVVLFVAGIVIFAWCDAIWLMFVGMFVYTCGEVVSVLGANPYTSRRIPASHRGRVGGVSNVIFSVFSSLMQFFVSFLLKVTESNYRLIWSVFIVIGIAAAFGYGIVYKQDKKMFPKLYVDAKF